MDIEKTGKIIRATCTMFALGWAFYDWHYITLFALLQFDDEIALFLTRLTHPKAPTNGRTE